MERLYNWHPSLPTRVVCRGRNLGKRIVKMCDIGSLAFENLPNTLQCIHGPDRIEPAPQGIVVIEMFIGLYVLNNRVALATKKLNLPLEYLIFTTTMAITIVKSEYFSV